MIIARNQCTRAQTPSHVCSNTRPRSKHLGHLWKFKTKGKCEDFDGFKRENLTLVRRVPKTMPLCRGGYAPSCCQVSRASELANLPFVLLDRSLPMALDFFQKNEGARSATTYRYLLSRARLCLVSSRRRVTTLLRTIIGTLDS